MLRLHPDFLEGLPEWFVDHANPVRNVLCYHWIKIRLTQRRWTVAIIETITPCLSSLQ